MDRYRTVDRYSGVDRYSESKLEPLTVVCPSTVAVRGPITGQWTAIGPWTAIVDGTAIGYHIYREIQSGIFIIKTSLRAGILSTKFLRHESATDQNQVEIQSA